MRLASYGKPLTIVLAAGLLGDLVMIVLVGVFLSVLVAGLVALLTLPVTIFLRCQRTREPGEAVCVKQVLRRAKRTTCA